jgi:tetratricopeptide (TPR) repeat protein
LAIILCGCSEDKRYNSIYTTNISTGDVTVPPSAMEVDLVEDMSAKREEYVVALRALQSYYEQSGNYQKTRWTKRELELLGQAPQYTYIPAGQIVSENLKAVDFIPEADELYARADDLYMKARMLALIGDKPKLRQALSLFNELINKYPTSDKIDDSAYKAGIIYQTFGDDKLAATYYQRAYQWDDQTPYPARFKAAYLMDNVLGMKAMAFELYQYAVQNEGRYGANLDYATTRIKALANTEEVKSARKEVK